MIKPQKRSKLRAFYFSFYPQSILNLKLKYKKRMFSIDNKACIRMNIIHKWYLLNGYSFCSIHKHIHQPYTPKRLKREEGLHAF